MSYLTRHHTSILTVRQAIRVDSKCDRKARGSEHQSSNSRAAFSKVDVELKC